jgi:magnesium transporter
LPQRAELGSIELSNRIDVSGDTLRLVVPYFSHSDDRPPSPVCFLLTPQRLVTLRYEDSAAFDLAAARVSQDSVTTPAAVLLTILESTVAVGADRLQHVSASTAQLSLRIFEPVHRPTDVLRRMLVEVGEQEGRLTRMRLSSTGLQLIVLFLHDCNNAAIDHSLQQRVASVRKDLQVLGEFDSQLTDKLQFLLDAVLGFINIDQNDVIKVLTVASVVSIPPVILAGIWGMNFKNMPELNWPYGYALALLAIALSAVLPLLWFKHRRWM